MVMQQLYHTHMSIPKQHKSYMEKIFELFGMGMALLEILLYIFLFINIAPNL